MKRWLLATCIAGAVCSGRAADSGGTAVTSKALSSSSCTDFLSASIKGVTLVSANLVAAADGLPEYCEVDGSISGNVKFQVRLPTVWNNKLYFSGIQAFGGRFKHDTSTGLVKNYATLITDMGHTILNPDLDILDALWALNNVPLEKDFGYRAVHQATIAGKRVIEAYYGSNPERSYIDGCSGGGRSSLEEVQRYPDDYDGAIAGAPVLDFTGAAGTGYTWDLVKDHATDTSTDLTLDKLPVLGAAVLAACDGNDGLVDGQIDDPRTCSFDPASIQCPSGDGPDCLTAAQVAAVQAIYGGPKDSHRRQIYPGFPRGGETPDLSGNGWDFWFVSSEDFGPSAQWVIADQFLRYLAFHPDRPDFDFNTFNFDTDPASMSLAANILNATDAKLDKFRDNGGKLIMYQGWSDFAQTPLRTIQYWDTLKDRYSKHNLKQFTRLFMEPGAYHCGGGPGPNDADFLSALEDWVESGHAPTSIVATHFNDDTGDPDRTRPLCPYPKTAVYNGSGDINDAANFHCSSGD